VIPTYNRRDILLQMLRTLEHQSVPPDRYEVIVGVDGSTDGTVEALQALRPPYRLEWRYQENAGAVAAVNAAGRLARNEVLIIMGDDQLCTPNLIAAHLEAHERLGVVLVQGDYPLAPGHDRTGASMLYERSRRNALREMAGGLTEPWHIWGGNFSLRRSTFLAMGGADQTFRDYGAEDTDIGLRAAAFGARMVVEPRALSYHLHRVNRSRYGQQAFSEGRSVVRLARKHGLSLRAFRGAEIRGPLDRLVQRGWRWSPSAMARVGRLLTFTLGVADLSRIRPAQITAARVVRRFYRVGGLTSEAAR
jgi:GT2 family glycosyltransferase